MTAAYQRSANLAKGKRRIKAYRKQWRWYIGEGKAKMKCENNQAAASKIMKSGQLSIVAAKKRKSINWRGVSKGGENKRNGISGRRKRQHRSNIS